MSDKEIRADAKLKNLPEEELEVLWRFRYPEEGGEKMTLEAIAVEIPKLHDFTVSLSTLSEFYSWLRLKKRMDAAADRAQQAKLELAKDPDMTPEDLERVGQVIFTNEALEAGNVKAYAQLVRLGLQRKALEIDSRKLALLEEKARKLDELEAKAKELKQGGGLSAETLEMLEKQLKIL